LNDKIPGPIGKFYADQLKIWLKSESIESKAKLLFLEVLKDKRESDDVLMFLKKIAITRMSFESYDLFYRFLYSRGEMEVTQSEKLTLSKLFKIYKNNMEPVNLKETNFIEYQFNNEVNPPFNNLQELVTLQISQFQKNGVKDVVKYDEARKIGGEIWIPTYDLYNNFSSYFVLNLEDPFHIRRAIYPTLNDFANFSGVKDSIQTLFYYRFSESLYETQGIPIKINLETLNDFASKSSEFNFMKNDLSVASHSTLEKLLHQYFKHYHQQRSLIVYSDPSIFGVHPDHFRNAVESEFQQTFVTTSYVEAYENLDGQKTTKFLDQIGKKSVFILNTTKSIPIQKELHTQWIILKNSSFVISDYYFDDENKIEYFFFNENK
jgi:hypothetical protein